MTKATKIIIGIIIIAVILAGWKFYKKPAQVAEEKEPIKIGAVLSLTGYASTYGEFAQKAINLAVDEINQAGGANGRKVEVVFEDDKTEAKDAVSAFQKLVNIDKVSAVIGSVWDFTTQPLFPLAIDHNVILITPTNFRIKDSFELNGNSFAMMPSFNKVIGSIENYINAENIKKLAVVRFSSAFGQEITNTLAGIMGRRGQAEIVDEKYNEIGGNDFRTTILKLKQQKVDAVFLDMYDADMINFLQRARELKLGAKIITYTVALDLVAKTDIDKTLLENIVFINWETQPKAFSEKFNGKYNILPAKSADRSYDAVYVLVNALVNSEKGSVSKYMENNKFNTVNGEIKFTGEHIIENLPVEVDIIKDGKIVEYK